TARLPETALTLPEELVRRLNGILDRAERDRRQAKQAEAELRVRERELAEEMEIEPAPPSPAQNPQLERKILLRTLRRVERGEFDVRVASRHVDRKVARSLNRVIALNEAVAEEFKRVGRLVGKEGK